jgi:hypothetical protein
MRDSIAYLRSCNCCSIVLEKDAGIIQSRLRNNGAEKTPYSLPDQGEGEGVVVHSEDKLAITL